MKLNLFFSLVKERRRKKKGIKKKLIEFKLYLTLGLNVRVDTYDNNNDNRLIDMSWKNIDLAFLNNNYAKSIFQRIYKRSQQK
jgi:hypothetical protein